MPLFYFDIREGGRLVPADRGLVLDSVNEAEREATVRAAEIGRDKLPKGARDFTIKVRDEHRRPVLTVTVSLRVDRVQEPSSPWAA